MHNYLNESKEAILYSSFELKGFEALVKIFRTLRGEGGCPWDREQNHKTLRGNLLEETYEVLEALDEGESKKLCEELGDLLMQVVFHAQIAAEAGEFDIGDVIQGINQKLIHRHPHVFGAFRVKDVGEVVTNWEVLKHEERGKGKSFIVGVPEEMPALVYSQEIQRRAAAVGFDWEKVDDIVNKLAEEVGELRRVRSKKRQSDEFGDILFTLANVGRRIGIDLEASLREANRRFSRRFMRMEELARERGLDFSNLPLSEQDKLWEEVKKRENRSKG